MSRRVTVTSALPYIHGVPHLGNIVGSILPADIFHRYLDLRGVENVYICGSDVHGTPLELEAVESGVPVEDLKQENHEKIKGVLEDFEMDFTIYSDTHSEYNRRQTHDMFEELYLNGYINQETQTLPYSEEDERFLPDRYIEGECPYCGGLARGDQCDDCGKLLEPEEIIDPYSAISGSEDIDFRETTHLFLDLPEFKEELREWLEKADPQPVPDSSYQEVFNAIENVETRAITRDIDWGFDVPVERVNSRIEEEGPDVEKLDPETYEDKVLYVWFDAPIGYIGFTRELFEDDDEWKKYWADPETDVYYSIGKDNTIFHTIFWPSMLMGSSTDEKEYNMPHYEFIQQFLLAEDTKFSKSRGEGLSTQEALEMYPADYWRFYLASELPQQHDTTFSWDSFEEKINNVLNDTVGNFVNRPLSLIEDWFDNRVPEVSETELTDRDREVLAEAQQEIDDYVEAFENHDMKTSLDRSLDLARLGDGYLSDEEPWNNEERQDAVLYVSVKIIKALGVTLYPFTPDASQRIAEMLDTEIQLSEGRDELENALEIETGKELGEREILFEKINVEERREDIEYKEDEHSEGDQGDQPQEVAQTTEHRLNRETVAFDEFQNMEIKVGEVVSVEDHPNADRLYIVKIDVGETVLQTCAGLVNHYTKEELDGRRVIVLANLGPTELRGEKSECMMLAAEDDDENVSLLQTDAEMPVGSEIK